MRSANREAGAYFEQALDVLRGLPASHVNLERAVDLRLELRQAWMPLGDTDRLLETHVNLLLDAIRAPGAKERPE